MKLRKILMVGLLCLSFSGAALADESDPPITNLSDPPITNLSDPPITNIIQTFIELVTGK